MSLTALELELVVAELQALRGARVDAVRVHAERALTLELHGRSGTALLLLCAEPEVTRLHVASARPAQPDAPFAWQAPLRQALEGSAARGPGAPARRPGGDAALRAGRRAAARWWPS